MLPKTLPLFGKILPVQSIIESYQKTAGSIIEIDGLKLLVCVYDPFGNGLFGEDTLRIRSTTNHHKLEIDIAIEHFGQYPIGHLEKQIVNMHLKAIKS